MILAEMLTIPTEELSNHTDIPITILPDPPSLYRHIARHMADIVIANNREGEPTKMIVPVGPTQQYPEFAQIVNDERIDCRNLWTFNMDEYLTW